MAWFSSWKIGFQKSELKGHVVAFSKQAERYTAIFQFPHHATGSPNSQVSFCKHHLPLKKYVLHQQNWDPGTHEGTTNPNFRHSSAAADSSREIDLLAKAALLLHDLNLLFLLWFLRWLWHLWSRVALHAMCLRSLGGLAWHVWVPQAAFILSLLLVFGSRLCAPLAQWTGWALAAPVLWCTSEPRLSLPRRTWEATRESQFNQMSLSCGYNDWVANWPLSKLTAFCLRDVSYWQKCIPSPVNSKINLNKLLNLMGLFLLNQLSLVTSHLMVKEQMFKISTHKNKKIRLHHMPEGY